MEYWKIPEPSLDPPEYLEPICPICGKYAEFGFFNREGELVGCDNCLQKREAFELEEFF